MSDLFGSIFHSIAGPLLVFIGFFVMYKAMGVFGVDFSPIASIALALTPIWLPLTLFYITYDRWMWYVRLKFTIDNGRTTLRLHLPQEVLKSPEAMESVFTHIHNVQTPDNLMQSYIDGKHPLIFSFELVSIGGEIRFYINVPTKKTKNAVEAQLYAQYPGIEIVEEQFDYTDEVTWNPDKYEMMVFHMGKKENEVLPIKTYIDFGLDKMPKEEEKFEPMAAMIEQISKIKPYERVWVQFLVVPHTKKAFKNGYLVYKKPTWEGAAQAEVEKIMKRDKKTTTDQDTGEKQTNLTPLEREKVTAIERNVGKYAYETTIRWVYITETGKFDGDIIGPIIRTFAQYDIMNRNGVGVRWRTDFNYNFISDPSGRKKAYWKKEELMDYKLREYNIRDKRDYADKPKVMSAEELATMFHIPGSTVITPSMPRITSTRKEAPSNLPVGNW
ncbi:MAG: hypothetical protein R3B60_04665 [Candidatus Paceibacterota bacterium]